MTLHTSGTPDPAVIDNIFRIYNITDTTGDIIQADAVALFHGASDTIRTHAIKNRLMILHDCEPVLDSELSLFYQKE